MPVKISKFYKGVFILADKEWDPFSHKVEALIVIRQATHQESELDDFLWRADRFSTTEEIDKVDWAPLTPTGQSRIRKIVALIFHSAVKVC